MLETMTRIELVSMNLQSILSPLHRLLVEILGVEPSPHALQAYASTELA